MSLRGCSKLQVSFVVVVVVFSFKLRAHKYSRAFLYALRYKVIVIKGCNRKEKFLSSR